MNFNSSTDSTIRHSGKVANVDEIKAILFLGIKSDIPMKDPKRKVDIII
ncbi:MAG: hypothetical protein PQJ61_00790 [Spirochaetales bacterium]|uniref:Uncharacterized protein n=1 Tax=Candidatus Thalassospirochaeta sargassi TaxID=3119039 RepID=A0AAJ1I9S4_9SPIO|nr:hypothetical protein [Spirochaetales bacterium]